MEKINISAKIISTGSYNPEKLIPNSYFNQLYNEDVDKFLIENRNIYQRYFAEDGQVTSDLVVEAAKEALKNANLKPEDLDLIIISTDTPDYISPSTASVVQHKLGAKNAGSFDINTACAGFVTALDIGNKFISSDVQYKYVLVSGAYLMSRYLNFEDKKIATLFADGAGAVILAGASEGKGIISTKLQTFGEYHDYMGIYAGGSYMPLSQQVLDKKDHLLNFAKRIPPEFNSTHWPKMIRELAKKINVSLYGVDHFFFTQININSINDTLKQLDIPVSKAHNIMNKYGYTGSACIPMAIHDAAMNHKLKENDLVFLISSGGGAALAVSALRWSYNT